MKRGAVLEAEKPLTSQLLMTTLNEGSPYETLHTLISSAVSPFFKSYVKESGKGDRWVDRPVGGGWSGKVGMSAPH